MKLVITIETENAAFDERREAECATILRALADRLGAWQVTHDPLVLRDGNGNRAGTARWED